VPSGLAAAQSSRRTHKTDAFKGIRGPRKIVAYARKGRDAETGKLQPLACVTRDGSSELELCPASPDFGMAFALRQLLGKST
jgi:hypothetical protein